MPEINDSVKNYIRVTNLDLETMNPSDYLIFVWKIMSGGDFKNYLEVGISKGITFSLVASCGISVVGIDINSTNINLTKNLLNSLNLKAKLILGPSRKVLRSIESNSFDVVFVDADHSYEEAFNDIKEAVRIAKRLVLFHDIQDSFPGSTRAFLDYVESTPFECRVIPENLVIGGMGLIYKDRSCCSISYD